MIFSVTDSDSEITVLAFLKRKLNITHKSLMYLKHRTNGISVNGEHVTVRYMLKCGDVLEILDCDTLERADNYIAPNGILPDIIYEDDFILALNKPANTPTHPSRNHLNDTLANSVAELYSVRKLPFIFRPAGRLDRNTSGVVITSKTQLASAFLFNAARSSDIHKKYIAVLCGAMPVSNDFSIIEKGIVRTSDSIIMRTICSAVPGTPEWARTEYRVLASNCDIGISLVEAMPITGRTHQLRVHFSSIGHPILGDDLYGQPSPLICRHALHAYQIDIPKPFDSQRITITAPIPSDMSEIIHKYFGHL